MPEVLLALLERFPRRPNADERELQRHIFGGMISKPNVLHAVKADYQVVGSVKGLVCGGRTDRAVISGGRDYDPSRLNGQH